MSEREQQEKQPLQPNRMIRPGEVHVWWTRLDLQATDVASASAFLSKDEMCRADRFVNPRHRIHFIAAHAALRMILGRCLGIPPKSVPFVQDANGKPHLDAPYGSLLYFNLSHSAGIALLGVCSNRQIGIDIEGIRPMKDMESIARRYFTQNEYARIMNSHQSRREQMFFALWSMKEACLKGTGRGLSGLESLELEMCEKRPDRVLEAEYVDDSAQMWSIRSIETIAGYAAAVAVEGNREWILKCRHHGLEAET